MLMKRIAVFCLMALFFCECMGAAESDLNLFKAQNYAKLRKKLRAFYPDECHDRCKDPSYMISEKAINADLDEYAASHPGYDALDLRQACYRSMQKHFVPYLFAESPFYFEAGVNGGWIMHRAPARGVNRLCRRFYNEQSLVPDEEFRILGARARRHCRYAADHSPTICTMCHQSEQFSRRVLAEFARKSQTLSQSARRVILTGENSSKPPCWDWIRYA